MLNEADETLVRSLLTTAADENKPEAERYAAIKHACRLRGDAYQHVPLEELCQVAAAMQTKQIAGRTFGPLSLRDAAEAIATGRRARSVSRR